RRLGAQVPHRHAVMRQRPLLVVDDAQLGAEARTTTGVHALGQLLLGRQVERAGTQARGRETERFRHAPELIELDAPGRELVEQAARRGGPRGKDHAEMRQRAALTLHPVEEREPHRWYPTCDGDALAL